MPPKMKFAEGEKVFCFHGPLIYEAKCVKAEAKDKINRYFIHYNGWNSKWDEWVPENRILKSNDASIQKQRELQKAHHANQLKVKAAKKREKEEKKEKDQKDKVSTPVAEKPEPPSSNQIKPPTNSQIRPPTISQIKPPTTSQIKPATPTATPSRGRGRPSNAAKAEAAKAASHSVTSTPPTILAKDKLDKDKERPPEPTTVKSKAVDSSTVKSKLVDVSSIKTKLADTGSIKSKPVDTSLTKSKPVDAGLAKSKALETSSTKSKSIEMGSVRVKTTSESSTSKAKVVDVVQSKIKSSTESSTLKPKTVSETTTIKTKSLETTATKDVEPVTSADISSQSSIGSVSTVSSISEQPRRKRPRTEAPHESDIAFQMKTEFKINIPEGLKQWLVDDLDLITHQRYLVSLPSKNTVDDILKEYVTQKSDNVTASSETKGMADEVTQGIREYFNVMLGTQLLYKFERPQYADILSEYPEMKMETIYGAPHLLRLFVKLGGMLAYIALDEKSIQILLLHIQDFLNYMQKNVNKLFIADNYAVASPEYHRKALCY